MNAIKIVRLTTVPISLHKLLSGQPSFMSSMGFEIHLASANGAEIKVIEKESDKKVKILPLTRTLSPLKDLIALFYTWKYFVRLKPSIVHSHTPKAGIIGMLAAKIAGVPIRMHTVAGLPLMETVGLKRLVLNNVERLTSWSATHVYPNSFVQKEFMLTTKLCSLKKIKVIGKGSSNGIDTEYFAKGVISSNKQQLLLNNLEINSEDFVFGFVGRLVTDKGVNELVVAFVNLEKKHKNIKLLLVGPRESNLDLLFSQTIIDIEENNNIIEVGYVEDVRPYLVAMDIFVFPSYREGFPNGVLQAGAMELPCIVSDINGCKEIIQDGETGLIIPPKNISKLEEAMVKLMKSSYDSDIMGSKLRESIIKNYKREYVWECIHKEYKLALSELV